MRPKSVRMVRSLAPLSAAAKPLRDAIAGQVVELFHDRSKGEGPIVRRPDGLFGPEAVAWRVHGDVVSMLVGGVSSLLLQMLHPAVLAGVWDHSNFRGDMHGRLRRTARFIAVTTFSGPEEAEAAIERVRSIHAKLEGTLPDGTPYRADDPRLLAWVHATETISFLDSWIRYGEPGMSAADQDRYFAEMVYVGGRLGADPLPRTRAEALQVIADMRSELRCDERTREVARLVLHQPAPTPAAAPFQRMTMQAGVDLLPAWAREMHGLKGPVLTRPAVRGGALVLARTLRWALQR